MKGTVRIISGTMKGKLIPFANSKYDDADITPQRVKEALFSIIGTGIGDSVFADIFAGSGQIGFEAASRGAASVIMNEADRKRFSFIRKFVSGISDNDQFTILNMKAADACLHIAVKNIKVDYIFLDPPYVKEKGEVSFYSELLSHVESSGILNDQALVIVQHFTGNILPERVSSICRRNEKIYGTTTLTLYSHCPE